jgi:hypothetical protein
MELPLDVTLESDGDNHVDPKVISTDDDQSIPGECKKFLIYTELQMCYFSECISHCCISETGFPILCIIIVVILS